MRLLFIFEVNKDFLNYLLILISFLKEKKKIFVLTLLKPILQTDQIWIEDWPSGKHSHVHIKKFKLMVKYKTKYNLPALLNK